VRLLVVLVVTLMLAVGSCSPTRVNYAGCTTHWDSNSFPIIVSPDSSFTPEEVRLVRLATTVWNDQVGERVFVVIPGFVQINRFVEGVEFSHAHLREGLLGYCPVVYHTSIAGIAGRVWRGKCLLDREAIKGNRYSQVVIHELGHALGFIHDEEPISIMYPKIYESKQIFLQKHLDTVRLMMEGTYKGRSIAGLSRCF